MTKKFWNDWQNRFGETSQIWILSGWYGKGMAGRRPLLRMRDKIINCHFHGDAVDLVIERYNITGRGTNTIHTENEYLTLHRKEIHSIDFWNIKTS